MTQRTTVRAAICIAALLAALCGCGGGGSDTASSTTANPGSSGNGGSGTTPTPETIQGIATPSSVSVVTATNAQ